MKSPSKTQNKDHLQQTLDDLKLALAQWDQTPNEGPSDEPIDKKDLGEFKKKTEELLLKLSEQIKALDL